MEKKKMVITQSNHLTNAAYKLTLNEQRVMLLLISKLDSRRKYSAEDSFTVTAEELSSTFGIDKKNSYRDLEEAGLNLFERKLTFKYEEKGHYFQTRWVSQVEYREGSGYIKIKFAPGMIPLITELKNNFTTYELEHTTKFKSSYSHRIYQLLNQWKSVGRVKIKLDGMRQRLELGEYYDVYFRLKQKILEPSLKEINAYSNFKVEMSEIKEGRKVVGLEFRFKEKSANKARNSALKPVLISPYKQAERSEETASLPDFEINSGLKKITESMFEDFLQ